LVSVLPATPETRDLINRDTLSRLQPVGYLINVARGAQLVEEDLLALLESGHMAGAALDVFRTEPLPQGHPFWAHPQIHITPHSAALTIRADSVAQIAAKLAALQNGQPVAGLVDRQRGY
jgi:glyoxylate/hydroxypyruvate reductase A